MLEALGSYPIAELQERARAMRERGEPIFDFSIGDPNEPTPEFIRRALGDAVPEVSQYPTVPGLPELRIAIAAYVRRRMGVELDPETEVLPTSGSKEGIFHTPPAFVDRARGDAVVFGTPAYPVYERAALFAGAEPVPITLGGDFVLRAAMIPDDAWRRAALVWSCSPHNPTGAVTPPAALAELLEASRDAGAILCADEAYGDIYDDEPPPSALEVAGPDRSNLLTYLSLSKRSGMTGYRSGAIVGDAEAIAALRALRGTVGAAPPEFVQAAAVAAWGDDEHVAARRRIFADKRARLAPVFADLGMEVQPTKATIFMWVRVGDDVATAARLLDARIVVSPGRIFGPGGEGYIRLALVPGVDECEAAGKVIRSCLSES